VKNRVLHKPYQEKWIQITAKYSRLNYGSDGKNEIEITSLKDIEEINNKVRDARQYCINWILENKNLVDLNQFKKIDRFKEKLFDLNDLDLNSTIFIQNDNLIFSPVWAA